MAQTLSSNMGLNLPLTSKVSSRYLCPSRPIRSPQVLLHLNPIKAMVGDAREKLDHVPRQNEPQSQPKRRVAPTSPIVGANFSSLLEEMLVVKAEKAPKKKKKSSLQRNGQEEGNGDEDEKEEEEEQQWSAKSYGRYCSRIALLEKVQFEKIKAEVRDGVLCITIPKAASHSNILDIHVQ